MLFLKIIFLIFRNSAAVTRSGIQAWSAARNTAYEGTPQPVTASQPGAAGKPHEQQAVPSDEQRESPILTSDNTALPKAARRCSSTAFDIHCTVLGLSTSFWPLAVLSAAAVSAAVTLPLAPERRLVATFCPPDSNVERAAAAAAPSRYSIGFAKPRGGRPSYGQSGAQILCFDMGRAA